MKKFRIITNKRAENTKAPCGDKLFDGNTIPKNSNSDTTVDPIENPGIKNVSINKTTKFRMNLKNKNPGPFDGSDNIFSIGNMNKFKIVSANKTNNILILKLSPKLSPPIIC